MHAGAISGSVGGDEGVEGGKTERGGMLLVLHSCQFFQNKAAGDGGAVHWSSGGAGYRGNIDRSSVEMIQTTFRNNSAEQDGGAMAIQKILHVKLVNVLIDTCKTATGSGGGSMFHRIHFLSIMQCDFTNNEANSDGSSQ